MAYLPESPSQTAGPYVHIGLIPHQAGFDIFANQLGAVRIPADESGERIRIEGRVLDGLGVPCLDVLLEIWQADAAGRYDHPADTQNGTRVLPGFRGWGRTGTDFATGIYAFDTIKPGPVAGRQGETMAPHVQLWLVARGINIGLSTRLYFDDERDLNNADPVLRVIDPALRRNTLIAQRTQREGNPVYLFDIHLQGDLETVFFDV
jgi:protocatechuate 3,4-dioxygenase alpha subunit